MAVTATITFAEPAEAAQLFIVNAPGQEPMEALYSVAGVLDYYGAPAAPLPPEAAEAAIDPLLGVVGTLLTFTPGNDSQLVDAIEAWLAERERF